MAGGPGAIEYTRWGSVDLTPERVEAFAAQGVTRLVISPRGPDPAGELSAFAERHVLA